MSSLFEFLTSLLNFVTGIFSGKKEDKKNLWAEIVDCRDKLSQALADGRITDVLALRKELDRLMKKYSRSLRNDERSLRRARRRNIASFLVVLSVSSLVYGCAHTKGESSQVLVIGERINIVKPGSTVEVPELKPPAKTWYLLDNVAIQQWLGIPVDYKEAGR